jgi:AraC-like DNA-binding protein
MINDLTGFPILQEGMLRAAPLGPLPRVVEGFGVSFDAICRQLGLPSDLLADTEAPVSIEEAGRLLSACAQRTACPHLGLLVGETFGLETMGAIGSLARQAVNVGAALRGLILALHLHDRATVPDLASTGDTAILSTVALAELAAGGPEVADLTMMACHNLVRELGGPGWRPREVQLARRTPADPEPYRRIFRAPVRFDADHNALVFDRRWLSRPVRERSGLRGEALAEMAKVHPVDLPLKVRRACVTAILIGDASVERLAKLAGFSHRSLNRHLSVFGTTARYELQRVRLQMARQLLAATDLPVRDIAALLSYSDAAAFTRAFRSRSGSAPSRWRDGEGSGSPAGLD